MATGYESQGVTGFELYQIATEGVTADLIIWNRYKRRAPGLVEIMLDANPQLSKVHKTELFIPVGTCVRVPINISMLQGKVLPTANDKLWTDANGYTI